jgi:hypothetical protein
MSTREEQIAISAPALCLPDDRSEWAAWLERQLVGLNLPKLCKQLVTLGGTHPPRQTLEEVLGVERAMVLQSGLKGQVSVQQLQQLLSQPALLLDLQAMILEEGSDYWIRVQPEPSISASVDLVRKKVMSSVTAPTERDRPIDQAIKDSKDGSLASGKPSTVRRADDTGGDNKGSWYWLGALLATAAAILIVVMNPVKTEDQGEFFAAAELRTPAATARESLERIERRIAKDWKKVPLDDNETLVARLITFRDSCDFLIGEQLDDALRGLTIEKRQTLKERCQKWKDKAETMIAEFRKPESTQNLEDNRKKANELIDKLQTFLREFDAGTA